MIAIATCLFIVGLLAALVHWIAAIPLVRAITNTIDAWADEVNGEGPEPLR